MGGPLALAAILFLLALLALARARQVDCRWDLVNPPLGRKWRVLAGLLAVLAALALFAGVARAQDSGPTRIEMVPPSDTPGASVPLRDFLSAQIERIERQSDQRFMEQWNRFRELLDERDRLVTQRFNLTDKQVEFAFTASERASQKAEEAQGLRNIVQNEFRGSLSDLSATMAPRDWVEVQVAGIIERIDRMQINEAELDRKITEINSKGAGAILFWQLIAGVVIVIGVIMGIMFGLRRDRSAI